VNLECGLNLLGSCGARSDVAVDGGTAVWALHLPQQGILLAMTGLRKHIWLCDKFA
jgi:hypothetical protein